VRVINCEQGTPEWHAQRSNRPTASRFDKIITAAKGQYSSSAKELMALLIAEQLPGYEKPRPTYWIEWGVENEPNAVMQYEFETDYEVSEVGFVLPDDRDDVGCSPDRLVNDGTSDGLLEVKCPKPETLVGYHINGGLPSTYKAQVFGQLWVTGLDWCDFYAWHPELKPYLYRVERDEEFISKIESCVDRFCEEYESIKEKVSL